MSDLQELAAAASSARPKMVRPRKSRLPLVLGIVAMVAGGIGAAWWAMRSQGMVVGGGVIVASDPFAGARQREERQKRAGFTVESRENRVSAGMHEFLTWSGWEILNKDERPLVVRKVSFNGDFRAVCRGRSEPVTLTIGDKAVWLESVRDDKKASYPKEVIFIDIETDRGTFRYRPDSGFDD